MSEVAAENNVPAQVYMLLLTYVMILTLIVLLTPVGRVSHDSAANGTLYYYTSCVHCVLPPNVFRVDCAITRASVVLVHLGFRRRDGFRGRGDARKSYASRVFLPSKSFHPAI